MTTMNPAKFAFKRPELLVPKSPEVRTVAEAHVLKLERTPIVVKNPSYTPDKLLALLNKLETRGEVIKQVVLTDWTLGCRMQDDITGILAKGTDAIDLSHYVWYGRADCWQVDLQLDDMVNELLRRHGTAIKPGYLKEKCLQLEFTVKIIMLDR